MINLIKNEFTKILKKKSFYLMFVILLAIIILSTLMYKVIEFFDNYDYLIDNSYVLELEENLREMEAENNTNTFEYAYLKSEIEIEKIINEYQEEWKNTIIYNQVRPILDDINIAIYVDKSPESTYKELIDKKDEILSRLKTNDWKFFVTSELEANKIEYENNLKQLEDAKKSAQIASLQENINYLEMYIQGNEYRLKYDISYEDGYLNNAIYEYVNSGIFMYELENARNTTEENNQLSEKDWQNTVERHNISKYVIENQVDVYKMNDTKWMLATSYDNYTVIIIVILVILAANIMSEEFNKGTIKLLLIKPYSRIKILLSKYFTVVLIIPIVIVFTFVAQLIVSGIIFGFEGMDVPQVVYNFNTNSIETMNIFTYVLIQTIHMLPLFIIMLTIAFAIGTITANNGLAIAGSLLLYMGGSIINMFAQVYELEFMKFFLTLNWDIKAYMFGHLAETTYTNLPFSLIVCAIYYIAFMASTIICFKRKNIKNI